MTMKALPDRALLNELLSYDPLTGLLTWKFKQQKHCPDEQELNRWNARHAGKPAFNSKHIKGYLCGTIDSVTYLTHRIIWKLVYGFDPDFIDHDDGDRSNNKLVNLIDTSRKQNNSNAKKRNDNSSGVTGVFYKNDKWVAYINHNKKRHNLGTFNTKDEAVVARKQAEIKFGFNPNHGR